MQFATKEIFYQQPVYKFSLISLFFFKLRRNRVKMDSIEEALLAIFIGIVVAKFLRKTSRVLQAIEAFKECLIKLHSQVLAIDGSLANTMFRAFYMKITFAYVYIKDYTSTEKTVMTPLKKDGYIYSWQQYFRYKVSS